MPGLAGTCGSYTGRLFTAHRPHIRQFLSSISQRALYHLWLPRTRPAPRPTRSQPNRRLHFGIAGAVTATTMPKAGFYAVRVGRKPGIYTTWAEAEAQVKGFVGAKHKKFTQKSEAEAFIAQPTATPIEPRPARIDESKKAEAEPAPAANTPRNADLPPSLARLASFGWNFTSTPPYRLIVYTDGSGLSNGQMGARAGLGVWWGDRGDAACRNLSERVPGDLQTNNRGEILSVIRALETCPYPDIPIEIRTDSQYTINCMTVWQQKWLATGALNRPPVIFKADKKNKNLKEIKNADLIKHLLVLLRRRHHRAKVWFEYVPAHTGLVGNEAADRLAKRGALMPALPDRVRWLDPDTTDESQLEDELELDDDWQEDEGSQPLFYTASSPNVDVKAEVYDDMDDDWPIEPEALATLERQFKKGHSAASSSKIS